MTCLKKQYTIFDTCTVSLRPQTIVFWREAKTENTCKLFYSVYLTIFIFNYFLNCVPKITYLCSKLGNNETHTRKYTIMNLLYRRNRSAVL